MQSDHVSAQPLPPEPGPRCSECGAPLPIDARECDACGAAIATDGIMRAEDLPSRLPVLPRSNDSGEVWAGLGRIVLFLGLFGAAVAGAGAVIVLLLVITPAAIRVALMPGEDASVPSARRSRLAIFFATIGIVFGLLIAVGSTFGAVCFGFGVTGALIAPHSEFVIFGVIMGSIGALAVGALLIRHISKKDRP